MTYTATDNEGNIATCSFDVSINDTTLPQIVCPSNITTTADESIGSIVVDYTAPVGTDNCSVANTNLTAGLGSGASFPIGNTVETYTVTDGAGNGSSCSFTVTVTAVGPPQISDCPGPITQGTDANVCEAQVSWIAPTASDEGSVVSFTSTHSPGSIFPLGTTTVTYTATDNDGNTTTCSFDVVVEDTGLPQVTCPSDITSSVDVAIGSIVVDYTAPTGTDNCSVASTNLTAGLGSGSSFPIGSTVETYTVIDGAGNEASCSFTITVNGVGPPQISDCPGPITQGTDADVCEAQVSWIEPTASDEGSVVSFTSTHSPGSIFPLGTTTVTYTATDNDGNTTTCSFDVVVEDTGLPQVTCPSDITSSVDVSVGSIVVDYTTPTGTDNCSVPSTNLTAGLGSGSSFPIGSTVETYTVIDGAGNEASCSFTITVNGVGPPEISDCPGPITQGTDADVCEAQVSWVAPTASDEGSVVSFTSTHSPGSIFPLGTTTVTYTATDNDGNTTTCSFDVVVEDTEAPQIDCPSNISTTVAAGVESTVIDYAVPVGTDNCSGAITDQVGGLGSGSAFPLGTTTETYEVSDVAGNSTSCSFTITVEAEVQGPSIQSFVLVDASTNQDILTITEGAQIVLGDLPGTYLNIYAVTGPAPTNSVELSIQGALSATRTENVAPYALYGDNGGDFNGETFGLGQYTVSAQAFEGSSGSGESGPITSVNFEIVTSAGSARIGNQGIVRGNQDARNVQLVETNQQVWNKSIQLYPNPANEQLNIQLGEMADQVTNLYIFDPMGRPILQKNKADISGSSLSIPLNKWRFSEGLYVLGIKTEEGLFIRRRFVVNRK